MKVNIYTDGGSRGNPGPAGIGVAVFNEANRPLMEYGEFIGTATNNVAEYKAVIKGLELAKDLGATQVEIIADSELMVKQMTGIYKVKNENLQPLYRQVRAGMQPFAQVNFRHVKREFNKDADRLANAAMDKRGTVSHNFDGAEVAAEPVAIKQEVLAQGQERALTKVYLAKGTSLPKQSQAQEQTIYVLQGKVRYFVGAKELVLGEGEACVIPSQVEVGLEVLENAIELRAK